MPLKDGKNCPFYRLIVPPRVTYCRVQDCRFRTSDENLNRSPALLLDRKFSIATGILGSLESRRLRRRHGHHRGSDQTDVLNLGGKRQKIAEDRLSSRSWKESLSTLTRGLLQDFGSALTGIFSLSELYHSTLPLRHPLREGLALIRENAAEAQRLVRMILELNSDTAGERSYLNLGRLVRDQLDLLKLVLPRGTQLTGPGEDGAWPVHLDETAFRQTLVNLAMNARDALRGPGDIRIALRALAPGESIATDAHPLPLPLPLPAVELTLPTMASASSPPT